MRSLMSSFSQIGFVGALPTIEEASAPKLALMQSLEAFGKHRSLLLTIGEVAQIDRERDGFVVATRLDELIELRPSGVNVATEFGEATLTFCFGGCPGLVRARDFGFLPFRRMQLSKGPKLIEISARVEIACSSATCFAVSGRSRATNS